MLPRKGEPGVPAVPLGAGDRAGRSGTHGCPPENRPVPAARGVLRQPGGRGRRGHRRQAVTAPRSALDHAG